MTLSELPDEILDPLKEETLQECQLDPAENFEAGYKRLVVTNYDNRVKSEEQITELKIRERTLQEQLDRLNRLRLEGLDGLSFDETLSDETLIQIGKNWSQKRFGGISDLNHDEVWAWMKCIQGVFEQIHLLVTTHQIKRSNKEKSRTILISDIRQRELNQQVTEVKKQERREKMDPENRAKEKAISGIMTAMKCTREKAMEMLGGLS